MTPDTLEATAARYDRWYGTKPGDGGTSDQLRAGAQAMRRVEEFEYLMSKVDGLSAILDRNENKGPLSDIELMFCWLAAQDLRAAIRAHRANI